MEYLTTINQDELLPNAKKFLTELKNRGIKISLGSASKNSRLILDKLNITHLFDAIVDGTMVSAAKPDPEVFP